MIPLDPPLTFPKPEARIHGELHTSCWIFKCHESCIEVTIVYPPIDIYTWNVRVKFKMPIFQPVLFQDTVAQEDLSRGPSLPLLFPPFHWEGSWVWIWVQPSWISQLHPYIPHYATNSTPLASGLRKRTTWGLEAEIGSKWVGNLGICMWVLGVCSGRKKTHMGDRDY